MNIMKVPLILFKRNLKIFIKEMSRRRFKNFITEDLIYLCEGYFFHFSFFIITNKIMPQFSPLWLINLISWTFAIISFIIC
jgi:hypothetical protein